MRTYVGQILQRQKVVQRFLHEVVAEEGLDARPQRRVVLQTLAQEVLKLGREAVRPEQPRQT